MIAIASHEVRGPTFAAGTYLITPVCTVTVRAVAGATGGGVTGSVEPVVIVISRGSEEWRVPVPRQAMGGLQEQEAVPE